MTKIKRAPWLVGATIKPAEGPHYVTIHGDMGRVADVYGPFSDMTIAEVNAEKIVVAANCHDDLVEALQVCLRASQDGIWYEKTKDTIKAALEKVRQEKAKKSC